MRKSLVLMPLLLLSAYATAAGLNVAGDANAANTPFFKQPMNPWYKSEKSSDAQGSFVGTGATTREPRRSWKQPLNPWYGSEKSETKGSLVGTGATAVAEHSRPWKQPLSRWYGSEKSETKGAN